jgi:DNA-binding MurR/RpiR family transcriptional regulator
MTSTARDENHKRQRGARAARARDRAASAPPETRETPGSYDALRRLLQDEMATFAPGQRRIAQIILADPEATAFRTIGETARAAQVAESSLVRFAAGLGLSGYPALAQLCREQLAERTQLVRRFEQAQQLGSGDNLLVAVTEQDQRNIAETMSQIDARTWDEAVAALARASAVHVVGFRKCFAVSYLLAYLLRLVRPRVHLLSQAASGLPDELRDIGEDDVFVAVSIHRYTMDTVAALQYAKQRGLRTIVVTDTAASPLFPHGDIVFLVETGSVNVLRSIVALTSLVQALATGVAIELGTASRSDLLLDEELLATFNTYAAGPEDGTGTAARAAR